MPNSPLRTAPLRDPVPISIHPAPRIPLAPPMAYGTCSERSGFGPRALLVLSDSFWANRIESCLRAPEVDFDRTPMFHVESAAEALECLEHGNFRAVLIQADAGSSALETFLRVRRHSPEMPVLLLTSPAYVEHALSCVRAGASGYVLSTEIDPIHLRDNVAAAVERRARATHFQDSEHLVGELSALIPMCPRCRSLRHREEYWRRVEGYLAEQSGSPASRTTCPRCHAAQAETWLHESA